MHTYLTTDWFNAIMFMMIKRGGPNMTLQSPITDSWPQWLVKKLRLSRYHPDEKELNSLARGIYLGEDKLTPMDITVLDGLSRRAAIHSLLHQHTR
jgi:hypothetical protein